MLRGWQESPLWEERLKKKKALTEHNKKEPYAAVQTLAVPNILF